VIAGYTVAYAMLLVTGARLGGRLGHRRVFLAGLALFCLASLACGLATSAGMLIGRRLVQGASVPGPDRLTGRCGARAGQQACCEPSALVRT
jgi:MFS family permease